MDYKYITQLLERYWNGETSLEEEKILRAFFSQDILPADLMRYKPLFAYEQTETADDVLGDDFDEKLLAMVDEPQVVRARSLPLSVRLRPLFKAAAVVAICLTLGNAIQLPLGYGNSQVAQPATPQPQVGASVAMTDSVKADSLKRHSAEPMAQQATSATILK